MTWSALKRLVPRPSRPPQEAKKAPPPSARAGSGRRLSDTLTGIDTPTLRGVWAGAPYLHDGSAATLSDAVSAHEGITVTPFELDRLSSYLQAVG
jgi:large repetitive protein